MTYRPKRDEVEAAARILSLAPVAEIRRLDGDVAARIRRKLRAAEPEAQKRRPERYQEPCRHPVGRRLGRSCADCGKDVG